MTRLIRVQRLSDGAWWLGAGRWSEPSEEPPPKALRFSSVQAAEQDIGRQAYEGGLSFILERLDLGMDLRTLDKRGGVES